MSDSKTPVIPFEQVPFLQRLCTGCKYSEHASDYTYYCVNPKQGMNMVNGKPRKNLCSWHRNMSVSTPNCCAGKGLWWESREQLTKLKLKDGYNTYELLEEQASCMLLRCAVFYRIEDLGDGIKCLGKHYKNWVANFHRHNFVELK